MERHKEWLKASAISFGLLAISFCAFPAWLKQEVRRQQNYRCDWCGEKPKKLTIHHIIPQSMGGADTIDNAVGLCRPCHDYWDKEALENHNFYKKRK
jgi:5-methylcytosine-specific restriction endonuclease McrA